MKKIKWLGMGFVLCMLWCGAGAAATAEPDAMLKSTSDAMIAALKDNQAAIKKNPGKVEELARTILLPHVDIPTMSRLALGREDWTKATPAQRQQFMTQFTSLMIRTYSSALAAYTDQTIEFKPIRGGVNNRERLQVDSVILQKGGPAIPVSYRVFLRDNEWKVYDMMVDGVSMVQSFRSQFASEIARDGITGLLEVMVQHGAKG